MAITTAAKFDYDVPTQAEAMGIPPNILKVGLRKVFGATGTYTLPDVISFIELAKAYPPKPDAAGVIMEILRPERLLVNGDDSMLIGLYPGEGTDLATVQTFIDKAILAVVDLSTWRP